MKSADYFVPQSAHDLIKAFLLGAEIKFETSQVEMDTCCFSLYDMTQNQAAKADTFIKPFLC